MNIMIFGGMGKTAEPIIDLLNERGHSITVFDISPNSRDDIKAIQGDICDREAVRNALAGIDVVLHLAVNIADIQNAELSFRINVYGTYNILYSAMLHNIPKILIASSAPVHNVIRLSALKEAGAAADYVCSAGEDFAYDLTKHIQETMAEDFCRAYAMNCLVLRLGHIVDGRTKTALSGEPLAEVEYCRGGWVCRHDVARAFAQAAESDFVGYHLINVIGSHQAAGLFETSSSKELLSFECEERFHEYIITNNL